MVPHFDGLASQLALPHSTSHIEISFHAWLKCAISEVHGKVSSHGSLGAWEPYFQDLKVFPKGLSFQTLDVSRDRRMVC